MRYDPNTLNFAVTKRNQYYYQHSVGLNIWLFVIALGEVLHSLGLIVHVVLFSVVYHNAMDHVILSYSFQPSVLTNSLKLVHQYYSEPASSSVTALYKEKLSCDLWLTQKSPRWCSSINICQETVPWREQKPAPKESVWFLLVCLPSNGHT
jgi:hypothetical protein